VSAKKNRKIYIMSLITVSNTKGVKKMGKRKISPHDGELVYGVIEEKEYAESLAAGAVEFELRLT